MFKRLLMLIIFIQFQVESQKLLNQMKKAINSIKKAIKSVTYKEMQSRQKFKSLPVHIEIYYNDQKLHFRMIEKATAAKKTERILTQCYIKSIQEDDQMIYLRIYGIIIALNQNSQDQSFRQNIFLNTENKYYHSSPINVDFYILPADLRCRLIYAQEYEQLSVIMGGAFLNDIPNENFNLVLLKRDKNNVRVIATNPVNNTIEAECNLELQLKQNYANLVSNQKINNQYSRKIYFINYRKLAYLSEKTFPIPSEFKSEGELFYTQKKKEIDCISKQALFESPSQGLLNKFNDVQIYFFPIEQKNYMSFINFDIDISNIDYLKFSINFELENNTVFECQSISQYLIKYDLKQGQFDKIINLNFYAQQLEGNNIKDYVSNYDNMRMYSQVINKIKGSQLIYKYQDPIQPKKCFYDFQASDLISSGSQYSNLFGYLSIIDKSEKRPLVYWFIRRWDTVIFQVIDNKENFYINFGTCNPFMTLDTTQKKKITIDEIFLVKWKLGKNQRKVIPNKISHIQTNFGFYNLITDENDQQNNYKSKKVKKTIKCIQNYELVEEKYKIKIFYIYQDTYDESYQYIFNGIITLEKQPEDSEFKYLLEVSGQLLRNENTTDIEKLSDLKKLPVTYKINRELSTDFKININSSQKLVNNIFKNQVNSVNFCCSQNIKTIKTFIVKTFNKDFSINIFDNESPQLLNIRENNQIHISLDYQLKLYSLFIFKENSEYIFIISQMDNPEEKLSYTYTDSDLKQNFDIILQNHGYGHIEVLKTIEQQQNYQNEIVFGIPQQLEVKNLDNQFHQGIIIETQLMEKQEEDIKQNQKEWGFDPGL